MTGLLRYQSALLLRSQRWIAPLLLYAAFLAAGVRPGDPLLDSLGFTAAGLVPVTAWLVRVCVTGEPDAARDCAAAAVGPVRVHAAALLTALGGALLAAAAGTATVLLIADSGRSEHVEPQDAAVAGVLAVLACALTGAAVGALCSRPLVRPTGVAVLACGLGSLLAWGISGSPARTPVSGRGEGYRAQVGCEGLGAGRSAGGGAH
ncbi:hypothetical protein ACFXA3_24370, partial [Streptomyces sp. NPDC059456]|uniref:hypothetical protein n=1 Tax=Streptomyces sp. NPDC059456 TaxID=3346838 RepID=UPI0036AD9C40